MPSPNDQQIREKHPLAIRWFHWINFPVLFLMIWSGLLIYWAHWVGEPAKAHRIGFGDFTLFRFFPEGFFHSLGLENRLAEGMAWHFYFMWFFFLNGAVYVLFTWISGQWKHIVPGRGSMREAWQVVLHDLKLRKQPLPKKKFNGAQQIAYSSVILMGFGSLITGIAIYKPIQIGWLTSMLGGYQFARSLHFYLTIGFLLFFVVHIIQVIRAGWNNFRSMVTGSELVSKEAEEL